MAVLPDVELLDLHEAHFDGRRHGLTMAGQHGKITVLTQFRQLGAVFAYVGHCGRVSASGCVSNRTAPRALGLFYGRSGAESVATMDDRDAFGHYLSGLSDGEACFLVYRDCRQSSTAPRYRPRFQISLRVDDSDILNQVANYLGVGSFHTAGGRNRTAMRVYAVTDTPGLLRVVQHFDQYPLRAKKRLDYPLWRQVVFLQHAVSTRPPARTSGRFIGKWSSAELEAARLAYDALRNVRALDGDAPAMDDPNFRGALEALRSQIRMF